MELLKKKLAGGEEEGGEGEDNGESGEPGVLKGLVKFGASKLTDLLA